MARIGILTGGGDCPGLNAVIRAVVRRAGDDMAVLGFRYGWAGVMDGDCLRRSTLDNTRGLLHRGGTILGTSRTNPFREDDGPERIAATLRDQGLDALIAIGGEDTLGVARRLVGEHGIDVVGVPKTIDNDLAGTDFTFGFHTAVQIATDAIDRLHTTAESHNRVMVVEVMGRHAGWIAIYSGMAGGADVILVPERPFDVDEVCERIRRRHDAGRTFSIVVVSEGATAKDGGRDARRARARTPSATRGSAASRWTWSAAIEERTGFESRMTILGHVQRGGTPTAFDRVLATRFGVAAVDAVADGDFGRMVALHGTEIDARPARRGAARAQAARPRPLRDRRGVLRMSRNAPATHQDRGHDRPGERRHRDRSPGWSRPAWTWRG